MILWLLAASALADPASDLLEAREQVEQRAAEVALARAEGSGRSVIATRMAAYREAAAELERLEAAVGPPPEQVRRERAEAMSTLAKAVAEGTSESPARDVLASWLGDPAARAAVLGSAVDTGEAMPGPIRRGVLLDVVEQADALAVLLSFDAAARDAEAGRFELRALSLRRRGPGQTAPIEDEVAALRLDEEARRAEAAGAQLLALRGTVLEVRQHAVAALGREEDR